MRDFLRIAIDSDGILSDFNGHWASVAERVLKRAVIPCNRDYHLKTRFNLSKDEYNAVWERFNHAVEWGNVPLYAHASELVYALEDMGAQVYVVTSIREEFLQARIESYSGLFHPSRVLAADIRQAHNAKHSILTKIGAIAMLDDHTKNANAAVGAVLSSFLLDLGYTDLPPPIPEVTVIDDPMDYPEILRESFLRGCPYAG